MVYKGISLFSFVGQNLDIDVNGDHIRVEVKVENFRSRGVLPVNVDVVIDLCTVLGDVENVDKVTVFNITWTAVEVIGTVNLKTIKVSVEVEILHTVSCVREVIRNSEVCYIFNYNVAVVVSEVIKIKIKRIGSLNFTINFGTGIGNCFIRLNLNFLNRDFWELTEEVINKGITHFKIYTVTNRD